MVKPKSNKLFFIYTAKDGMSFYERNVNAWKETASLLWDISMNIVCLTFSSFSLLRGLPSLDGKNERMASSQKKRFILSLSTMFVIIFWKK